MSYDKDWMISDVAAVPGVRHVVVLSADGLITAQSPEIGRDDADRLAAACSGLQSIAKSVGGDFAVGATHHLTIAYDDGVLFVRAAGDGSHIAAITERAVDPHLIAQQMQAQVKRIGERNLATAARHTVRQ